MSLFIELTFITLLISSVGISLATDVLARKIGQLLYGIVLPLISFGGHKINTRKKLLFIYFHSLSLEILGVSYAATIQNEQLDVHMRARHPTKQLPYILHSHIIELYAIKKNYGVIRTFSASIHSRPRHLWCSRNSRAIRGNERNRVAFATGAHYTSHTIFIWYSLFMSFPSSNGFRHNIKDILQLRTESRPAAKSKDNPCRMNKIKSSTAN